MRPAIRLAALMEQRVVYVFTHDSIGVGEDGPTHQPIEQLAALRAIPNLVVFRPAEATETAAAWKVALERKDGPTALALTRQNLPILDRSQYPAADLVAKGAYILADSEGKPALILLASGSEVSLALDAQAKLTEKGVATRVVSMPSWELFDEQPQAYQNEVLPPDATTRLAIEMGVSQGWQKYVGTKGVVLGIDKFGASAPAEVVMEKYGFTVKKVIEQAAKLLKAKAAGAKTSRKKATAAKPVAAKPADTEAAEK
jgi:transketolase